jgi:uncharacterized protein YpiB (UPF0302 family)
MINYIMVNDKIIKKTLFVQVTSVAKKTTIKTRGAANANRTTNVHPRDMKN